MAHGFSPLELYFPDTFLAGQLEGTRKAVVEDRFFVEYRFLGQSGDVDWSTVDLNRLPSAAGHHLIVVLITMLMLARLVLIELLRTSN